MCPHTHRHVEYMWSFPYRDDLREHLKNAPKLIMAQQHEDVESSDTSSGEEEEEEESSSSEESSSGIALLLCPPDAAIVHVLSLMVISYISLWK